MPNTDTSAWKEKYLSTLVALEREQQAHEQTEKILRQAMSRLSLAVETRDQQFNAELESLRKTVRAGGDIQRIKQLMEDISASILRLDQRQGGADGIAMALQELESRIDRVRLPNDLNQATRDLRKRLQEAGKEANLRDALDAYSNYTDSLIDWFATQQTADKSGLFGRLFACKDNEDGQHSADAQSPLAADADESAASTPTATTEASPDTTGSGLNGSGSQSDAPVQPEAPTIPVHAMTVDPIPPFNQVLFNLIKRLDLPAAFNSQAQQISDRLNEPPSAALAGVAVNDIADLMAKSRHQIEQEKRDIEQFLAQLTGRLQELDQLLSDSFGKRERASAEGSVIDASMTAEVAQIHRSVAEAQDFEGLKLSIKAHIENIQAQMQARKQLEQTQIKLAEAEAERLRTTLAKTEDESHLLRKRLQDARKRALRDTLTGLNNRLAYEERMAQEIERWGRYARPEVLSIWDIDHFKKINDTFGHTAGDNALRAVAKLLQESTRKSDFLARFGGEEFMLLLPETNVQTALELANRLRERVAVKRFQFRGQPVPLSISCGLAPFVDKDTAEDIYRRADIALYEAKAAGRNCCLVFEPGMLPSQARPHTEPMPQAV